MAGRLIAIVGPTASGKSALALRVAESLGGEIVSADSRLVYRGMDIGTAKPSAADRARVPHHCIDVAGPAEVYDAARYRADALAAIAAVDARGRQVVLAGGTGLYVRAVLDGLELAGAPRDPALRARLEALPADEVFERLRVADGRAAAVARGNLRRAVRYLEIATLAGSVSAGQRRGAPVDALRVGLSPPRPVLDRAIAERVGVMVQRGVLEETQRLLDAGLDLRLPSMTAHGYVHWARHLARELSLDQAIALTVRDTRAYARRQMTWFRRNPQITWYDPTDRDPLDDVLRAAA